MTWELGMSTCMAAFVHAEGFFRVQIMGSVEDAEIWLPIERGVLDTTFIVS